MPVVDLDLKQAALSWAQDHGYPGDSLPLGIPGDMDNCCIARAIGKPVDTDERTWWAGDHVLPTPVVEFVDAFDTGCFPELVEPDEVF